jgi:hypothetical protein
MALQPVEAAPRPAFSLLFEPPPAERSHAQPKPMTTAQALAGLAESSPDTMRRHVPFEPERLASLRQLSLSGEGFDKSFAAAQLQAAEGAFAQADEIVARTIREHAGHVPKGPHFGTGLVASVLACQRPDIVAAYFSAREEAAFEIHFEATSLPLAMAVVAGIKPNRVCSIGFDESAIGGAHVIRLAAAVLATATLLARAAALGEVGTGRALFTLADGAAHPGLGFCASRPGVHLVPDQYFVNSGGYADLRVQFEAAAIAWPERQTVAFWRGATTGFRARPERHWSSLQRIALCRLSLLHPDAIDAGISKVVQAATSSEPDEIARAGLIKGSVPATEFLSYRYQIDVDGNTNSWPGLYMKLLTGCPVLKIASPLGYRQWYYDRLLPWVNYVPISADMSNLLDAIATLRADDARARSIGEAGRLLALDLDWSREITAAGPALSAAFEAASLT